MQNKKDNKRGYTRLVDFGDAILSRTRSASPKFTTGYTIIETMISVSIFTIVVVIGMGALLNANLLHKKSSDMLAIMDNLNFVMEDMSINLRTGYKYRCYQSGDWRDSYQAPNLDLNTPLSCPSGGTIVFESDRGCTPLSLSTGPTCSAIGNGANANTEDQWVYKIEGDEELDIYKSTDGGQSFVTLNPPEVRLNAGSGFSVLGAEAPTYTNGVLNSSSDTQQPFVTIRLIGTIESKGIITPFSLQTSVSQRRIYI